MKQIRQNEKGFTLVELVVVIAILAVLAALLVPRIMGNVEDARSSKEIANARTLASEITTYNAVAKVNDDGSEITALTNTELGKIKRSTKDLPDSKYADITFDLDGNATVTIKEEE